MEAYELTSNGQAAVDHDVAFDIDLSGIATVDHKRRSILLWKKKENDNNCRRIIVRGQKKKNNTNGMCVVGAIGRFAVLLKGCGGGGAR